jgi:hypothetical protein
VAGVVEGAEVAVAVPQEKQNRAPGTSASPHDAQLGEACVAPHVKQKRAPSGSASPQLMHVVTG